MDPHKNGTSGMNPPPPAHNMSVPPQHPHAMPMAQQMPARPMQPGYMAPRPAHTGSLPITKPNQAPGLLPKQSHPGAPTSPKLPVSSTVIDKPLPGNPVKTTAPALNVPNSSMIHSKMNAQLDINSAPKPNHNSPIPNYQQMQLPTQNSGAHQVLPPQQPVNAPHPMQHLHQHPSMHPFPQQQHVIQQGNTHLSSATTQQQNSNVQKPPLNSAATVNSNKQEPPKTSTPPVPDLISIKPQAPVSPKVPASENSHEVSKANNIPPVSNSITAHPVKPTQSTTVSITETNKQDTQNSSEQSRVVDVLPANSKPEAGKASDVTNTVTITPTAKPTENIVNKPDPPKNTSDNIPNVGQSQNGMPLNKGNKVENTSELKVPVPPKPVSMDITQSQTPSPQSSPLKQQQSLAPPKPVNKSTQPPISQVQNSTQSVTASPKTTRPSNESTTPSTVSKSPVVQPLPPTKTTPSKSQKDITPPVTKVDKLTPQKDKASTPKPEPEKMDDSTSPSKEKIDSATKTVAPAKPEQKVSPKKTPKARSKRKLEEEKEEVSEEEIEDSELNSDRRSKRKSSVVETPQDADRKSKRVRKSAAVYQSPIPEAQPRIPKSLKSTPALDRLVVFFKNEHVALRNAEGTFYICQIAQNVYKSTKKIKIRWLSPTDESDEKCKTFKADYYDITDFDCILTSVDMKKGEKGIQCLADEERERILNILQRAKDRDNGIPQEKSELREDHPDGLDLSLYNDESQLKEKKSKKGRKKTTSGSKSEDEDESEEDEDEEESEKEDEKEEESEKEDEKEEESEKEDASEDEEEKPKRGRKSAAAKPAPRKTPAKAPPAKKSNRGATPRGRGSKPVETTPAETKAKAPAETKAKAPVETKAKAPAETKAKTTAETKAKTPEPVPAGDAKATATPAARRRVRNFGSGPNADESTPQTDEPTPEPKKGGRSTRSKPQQAEVKTPVQAKTSRRSRK